MKIIIVTQNEPLFIPLLLRLIIPQYKDYLCSIVFLQADEFKNPLKNYFFYLNYWGIKQSIKFSGKFLRVIFKNKSHNSDLYKNIEIIHKVNVNSSRFIKKAREVDYVISIASNQIFRKKLLNAPKKMCLNIHAGLLPKYRGFNPSFWVLYNNEKITGVTIHKMTEGLDDGPVLQQETLKIHNNESWFSLQERVLLKAGKMLIKILPQLISGNLNLCDQKGETSKYRKPKIEHGIIFRNRGNKFI